MKSAPVIALAALAVWPRPAAAHLVGVAFGPFYAGALHVFVSAATMGGLVALAALAGIQFRSTGRWTLLATPPAVLAGAFLGVSADLSEISLPVMEFTAAIVLGATAALGLRLRPWSITALGAAGGLIFGLANVTAGMDVGPWLFAFGTFGAATALLIPAVAGLRYLADRWSVTLIGCRVLGGWAASIGIIAIGGRMAGIV